jgi:FimV-like protein
MAAVRTLQGDTAGLDKVYQQLEATGTEEGFVASSTYRTKQKDFSEALSIVNRGLDVHTNSATLYGLKGGLHQQQKQYDDAESAYLRLAGIIPERGNSLLANLYVQSDKQEKAKQLIGDLLRSDADKEYPYLLASGLALSNKQPEEAIVVLQQGIAAVTNHLRLQMQLATLYLATEKEQQAEQTYQRVIEEAPRFSPAYSSLGMINEQRGDKGKALELYRTALKYDQNNIGALNNLAYLLADNFGQEKEALQLAMKAYRSQPGDPRIMDTVGYVLLKNKNTKDALTLLKKANELLPEVATIKLHLAMAQAESGGGAAAKELLQQVLAEGSADEINQANKLLKSL